MSGAFDPDAYLRANANDGFDPDAYLAANAPAVSQDIPTISGPATLGAHAARHLAGGLGDKIMAAEMALGDVLHDKTGKVKFGEAYSRDLAFNDKTLEASDKERPGWKWAGNSLGVGGSLAALGLTSAASKALGYAPKAATTALPLASRAWVAAKEGMKVAPVFGAASGYGADRSQNASDTAKNVATSTALSIPVGGALAAAGEVAGPAAKYAGGKINDLAGWLKVNSLHPTPTLAESMAQLPGGKAGVGKELLQRGIGGITKGGTAKQIEAALNESGQRITGLADAASGGPTTEDIDLSGLLNDAKANATKIQSEPTTEAAGKKLADVLSQYEDIYQNPVSPPEALTLKRTLGKAAYGQKQQLVKSGDPIAGDYGAGLSKLERGVDSLLDERLGPEFANANLTYRRLLGASNAADRVAGRASGNHLLGLKDFIAGDAVTHGSGSKVGGLTAAIAHNLVSRYGSQGAARAAYTLGSGLEAAPDIASGISSLAPAWSPALPAMSREAEHLIPVIADDDRKRQSVLAALRREEK